MDLLIFKTKLRSLYPVSRELVVADSLIASVIVLLFNFDNKVFVLMTRRSKQLKIHPGEMSFPGIFRNPHQNWYPTSAQQRAVP